MAALAASLGAGPLRGQPTGGQVVAGTASLATVAGVLTVTQTSARAIITWQDFSLSAGTLARFIQPDAASATLNRVVSGLPSQLDGAIEANGRVYLINPNGIVVGAGARIDTAGFIASTLDVANEEFLAGGDLHFSGDSTAGVQNLGTINALGGDVFLIARQVQNSGTISATGGVAGLAAGSEVLLTTGGDERVFVQATSLPGAVVNSGAISGATAELKAAGGNSYALAINNTGWIRATGDEVRGGQIWLVGSGESTVASSGTLDASSASGNGGKIVVSGAQVLLDAGSRTDASGATGGGEVDIGGGWQQSAADLVQAAAVVMQPGALIDVSATTSGQGGKATLFSSNYTAFRGDIRATGGAAGGDGGQVETSSLGDLEAVGTVDASAVAGAAGAWALDPVNVTIAASGASGSAFTNTFVPTADSVILASSVAAALNGGSNVSISTGSTGSSTGDISVNAAIAWTTNQTLTLAAKNNVVIGANLSATGNTAGLVITPNANGGSAGSYSLTGGATITLSGSSPSLSIAGHSYTVINSLGVAGDSTTTTLQGIKNALSGYYALGSDINASATSGWNAGAGFLPIGNTTTGFSGTFDGLGHAITGLSISRSTTDDVGLFGALNASGNVRNVGVTNASISGRNYVGAVVGNGSTVTVDSVYSSGTVTGTGSFVGGLVGGGGVSFGGVSNGHSSATVSGLDYVGGVLGYAGNVTNSYATGQVSGRTAVGGLVGEADSTVYNSYATGNVTGTTDVGGLAGVIYEASLTVAYASGNVTGTTDVGGLVGRLTSVNESVANIQNSYATGNVTGGTDVGGLLGYNNGGDVVFTYESGHVTGTTNVGGLIGDNEWFNDSIYASHGIVDSVYDTTTSGQTVGTGMDPTPGMTFINGKTTAEMMTEAGFTWGAIGSYDTAGTWRLYTGESMPLLVYWLTPLTVTANNDSKTYSAVAYSGGTGVTYSIASPGPALLGTLSYTGTSQGAVNVGGYGITPSGLYSIQQGYNIDPIDGTLTIGKANLILVGTKVYDGTTFYPGSDLTADGVNGQTFTMMGAGDLSNLSSKNVQTGISLASFTGLALGTSSNGGIASNYQPLNIAVTLSKVDITPANLVLTGTRVYDGTTLFAGSNLTATGVDGETFTMTGAGATGDLTVKNVQTNQALASVGGLNLGTSGNGGLASNYKPLSVTGSSVSVTPAMLTLSGTMVYNGTTDFAGANLAATGVAGETFAITGAGAAGDLTSKNVQTNQLLASLTGLALGTSGNGGVAANYTALSTVNSSVSVTPATLQLTGTRVYDGTTIFAGSLLTATGVNGETFSVTGAGAAGDLSTKNVQTNQLLASVAGLSLGTSGNGGLASNYNVLGVTASSVSVTPAALTLSGSMVYNGTTDFTGSLLTATGVAGETFSMSGSGATGNLTTKNVQTNQLLASVAGFSLGASSNGGLAGNYAALSTVGSSVSVTPANLTLTGTKVYDGNTIFPGTDLTASGVNGETFTVTGVGDSSNIASKNVSGGEGLLTATGLVLGTSSNGGLSSNYLPLTVALSKVTVTPANLVLTGTRVYDGTTIFAGSLLTATGVNGETFSVTGAGAAGDLGTKNVQTNQLLASVAGLSLGTSGNGGLASNYNVLGVTASSVSVTPATLTLSGTMVYNGTTDFAGANLTATGVAGETFAVTGAGAAGDLTSKNVQTNQLLASLAALGLGTSGNGGLSSNYTALSTVNSSVSVTPATLQLSGTRMYDGTTVFAGSLLTATGVNGETFSVTGAGAAGDLSTKNVQSNQLLASVAGLSLGTSGNGGLASNYTALGVTASSVSVTPATLILSGTMVYNGTTDFAGSNLTATGVAGETFSVAGPGATGNLTTKNVQTNQLLASVAGLSLGTSGNGGLAGNYAVLGTVGSSVSVTPAPLTITADNQSRSPNTANPPLTVTYAGIVPGDTSGVVSGLAVSTTAVVSSSSGAYPITASGASASNYLISSVPGTLTIGDVILTIAANSQSKTYGASLPGFSATESGFILDDTSASVTGLQFSTVATASSNVGTYAITPFGATAPNYYTIQYVPGTLTINPAGLVLTAGSVSRLYGAANPSFSATYAGFVNGDTSSVVSGLSITSAATASSNVGTYAIVPAGGLAPNYTISYVSGLLTINPVPLTITANDASRSFNAANPPFTATYTGLVNGDTMSVVSGLTFTTPAIPSSPAGIYPVTPSGASALNYAIAYVPGHLSIAEDLLTITANNQSATYGSALPTFTASDSGFVNGDTAAVVTGLQFDTTARAGSNVGTYTITPFGATAPSYYTLDYISGTLTINPAALTITATSASRLYGAANPSFGATYAGFVNGDTSSIVTGLSVSTTAGTGSGVGAYPIAPSGAAAPNYTIGYVPGALTVNPAPLTITANSASRLYGTANPTFSANYAGFVNGDTSSVVSGLLLSTTATAASNVGGYAITPSSAAAANYVIGYVPGTLTINAVLLTVTAGNASSEFGAPNPTFTDIITGFVNGDTSAVVTGLTLTTSATAASPAATYAIVPGGAHATNYLFAYVPGTLTVTVPTVTLSGTTPTPVITIGQQPILTSDLAVIDVDNHLSLVPVNPAGDILVSTSSPSTSVDAQLNTTLAETETASPPPASGVSAPAFQGNLADVSLDSTPNFGAFEPASGSEGQGAVRSADPGLFRESSLKSAGFNVIYHEPLSSAQRQDAANTALGSSYREFSDSDNPQVTIVRSKIERKPSGSTRGDHAGSTP